MALLAFLLGFRAVAAAPDLTAVDLSTIDRRLTYNLGPTGLRGWIYIQPGYLGPATEVAPWQILVTTVGTGTPASGVLQVNDVILGASAGVASLPVPLFSQDARKSLGLTIGAAEAGDGKLNLKRWRAGSITDVTLQLQVLGAYSLTAPFNCPKSALILSNASKVLAKEPFAASFLHDPILGLALLAIGNPSELPRVQAYARQLAELEMGYASGRQIDSWVRGYEAIFLSEYYLQTGDTQVLDGLANVTRSLARSQSRVGTFGHSGAMLESTNYFEHFLGGYGTVNATAITANMGIVLGRKAMAAGGLPAEPPIDEAISRAAQFYSYFSGKGGIPYGEHEPWTTRSDNGKEAMAAVYFSLLSDRPAEAEAFARLSVADFRGREYGHTGPGLSFLWAGMGANVGGPEAAAAHLKEIWWHLDLARRSDGSFTYDASEEGPAPDISDYWAVSTYGDMSPTAMYVLTYAVASHRLLIHGREAPATPRLSSAQVASAVAAGNFIPTLQTYSNAELMDRFADADPIVRHDAASELGKRPDANLTTLTTLATAPDARQREAALHVLGKLHATTALPTMIAALDDPDNWVRFRAGEAIAELGVAAVPELSTLIGRYGDNADLEVPSKADPLQAANRMLGNALFGDKVLAQPSQHGMSAYLGQSSPPLLTFALGTGLRHPETRGRASAAVFAGEFATVAQINAVFPDLEAALRDRPPINVMWADAPFDGVVKAFTNHLYLEFVPLSLTAIGNSEPGSWGASIRAQLLTSLIVYGDAARWALPTLRQYRAQWPATYADYPALLNAIAALEAAASSPAGIRNGTPLAHSQVVVTETPHAIQLTGELPRPGTPTYRVLSPPAHGTLGGTAPNLTYTPAAGFKGLDRFTFEAADAVDASEPGTVSLIVGNGGAGLTGEYFANADFTGPPVSRVDRRLNFDSEDPSLDSLMDAALPGVRWTGKLLVPETGNYRFSVLHNGGVRLWLDGQLVLDVPQESQRRWSDDDLVPLTGGQTHDLVLEYSRATEASLLKLKWTGPSFAGRNGVLIDSEWLFPAGSGGNMAPVALAQNGTVTEDTPTAITLTGGDANHDPLTFAVLTQPAHGSLTGTPPNLTYAPAGNYNGPDSFTFRVNDGAPNSASATVSLTVTPVADLSLINVAADYSGPSANTATLKAQLTSDTPGIIVTAFWGATDGGNNPAGWAHSADAGTFPAGNAQAISLPVSGLAANTRYYFTFQAVPAVGAEVWAPSSLHFGPAAGNDLLTFGLPDYAATIQDAAVIWKLPGTLSLSALAPTFTASPGATVDPPSGTTRDFNAPQDYVVTAENGTQKTFTVNVSALPRADRFWRLTGASWNSATAWTNEVGAVTPLTAGGSPDLFLHFLRPGTYTANNNLAGTLALNTLTFGGATATLTGNALRFVADSDGHNPQIDQAGSTPVRIEMPIGLTHDLMLAGAGTGTVTIKGQIGSNQTTDGALIHRGAHLLYLDTPNEGFAGGLMVSNATLRATVGGGRTFGDNHDKWGQGGTAALKLSDALLELQSFDDTDWTWARMGRIELAGTNHIRALTKGGTFLRGDLHGSGLLLLDGQYPVAFANHRFTPTFTGEVLITSTNLVAVAQTKPLGSGGTVTMAAPGGGRLGIHGSGGASLDNPLQLDTSVIMGWTYNNMEFSFERPISGPGSLTKVFDAADRGTHLVLRTANTYSGGTIFKSGRLELFRGESLGTGPITLGGKASSDHVMAVVNRSGMTVTNPVALVGIAEPALSDPDALTEFIVQDDLTLAGNVTGTGGLSKTGPGTLTLSGINSWSGPTLVNQGTLALGSSRALGHHTTLTAASGVTAHLGFAGTLRVAGITLDGAALPPGIYGSATHPVFFTGTGQLDTRSTSNTITNLPAEVATGAAAWKLKAFLTGISASSEVRVYWGTVNGGSNPAAWANNAFVGSFDDVYAEVSSVATGLAPATTYYFTFRATIGGSDVWAANVLTFTTPGALGITTSPQTLTRVVRTTAQFTVGATGYNLHYRWQKNGVGLFDSTRVQGAGSATLTIEDVEAGDAADYRAVVSNSEGNVTSSAATLTVEAAPVTFLAWDANGTDPTQVDGTGAWNLATPNWWNGSANQNWQHGYNVQFGNGGTGGVVTMTDLFATRVNIGAFTGEYQFTSGSLNVLEEFKVTTSGSVDFKSALNGPGQLVLDGPGRFNLANPANTYSGGTVVNGGEFHLDATVKPGTGPITIQAGTQMALGLCTVSNVLTLDGGTLYAWNDVVWNAPIGLASTSTLHVASLLTVNAEVSGPGGLVKSDWGEAILATDNSYTGTTLVTRGKLICKVPEALGTGPLIIQANGKVKLDFGGQGRVDSLEIEGVTQPEGTYGSADAAAEHHSDFFEGPGVLKVGPATPAEENTVPVFTSVSAQNIAEGANLDLRFTATDADLPEQVLLFDLLGDVPDGVTLTPNGRLRWTPGEIQGPANYLFRAVVTDGHANATNEFVVNVTEANAPPQFTNLLDFSLLEGETLSGQLFAVDADIPVQALSFGLGSGPTGLTVSAAGVVSWSPSEAQGPGTNVVKVFVSDGVVSVTNQFTVTVREVNAAPVLAAVNDQSVDEGATLNLTLTATDSDVPLQPLTYGLAAGPAGLIVAADGTVNWTPTEAQGPGTNIVHVSVSDGVTTVNRQFTIIVREVNVPPIFGSFTDQTLDEGATLGLTLSATDSDVPVQGLTYGLVNGPVGLTVTSAGSLTWTPTETQGPSTNVVRVFVSDGAASATNQFTVIVREVNTAPALAAVADQSLDEGTQLTLNLSATDNDVPVQTLTYGLAVGPAGLTVALDGSLAWTPGETQGPGTNTISVFVSDGVASVTNRFTVVVREVNTAPVLAAVADQSLDEGTQLTLNLSATDGDMPVQALTYGLAAGPTGMLVTPGGSLTWTPSETQGPGTNTVRFWVSDGIASVTNQFIVTVREVNNVPAFAAVADQPLDEGTQLALNLSATDSDVPVQTLTFGLATGPAGLTVTSAGSLTWTPTEVQGPTTNVVRVFVTDGVGNVTNQFTVIVHEVNTAPVLAAVADQSLDEGAQLALSLSATDSDLPVQTLTYGLATGPSGLTVTSAGSLTWTPTEAQGPTTNVVRVFVSDGVASVTNQFTVIVREVNVAPTLAAVADQSLDEGVLFTLRLSATDGDVPTQTLTYGLATGPTGLTVAPGGALAWTPTEAQGPSTNVVRVFVNDGVVSVTNQFTVIVREVNTAPTLGAVSDQSLDEGAQLALNLSATDSDVPVQTLTYGLATGPTGLTVAPNGALAWTPTEAQGPSTNIVQVFVSDGVASVTNQFTIIVREVNSAPTLAAVNDQLFDEGTALALNLSASDNDVPAQTLTYGLAAGPTGLTVTPAGSLAWTPAEAQGPSTNIVRVFVSDGVVSVTNQFTVIVREVNTAPTLAAVADRSLDEGTQLTLNLTATDSDVPVQTLTYGLAIGPTGLAVAPGGALVWTPTEVQGPSTNTVRVFVNDGVVSVTNQFTIIVREVNTAPSMAAIADQSLDEEAQLTLNLSATDSDVPVQTLTYGLAAGPTGLSVAPNGALGWNPTETQGPSTNVVRVFVSDGVASVTNQFTVIVREVNAAPTLAIVADQALDEGTQLALNLSATDNDMPVQTLIYGLATGPTGLAVTPAGSLMWTPTEAQGPSTNVVRVFVNDGVASVTNQFTIIVREVNSVPIFNAIADQSLDEGTLLALILSASDSDVPAQSLTYGLAAGPVGLAVSPAGALSWTPTAAQGPSTNIVRVFVGDGVAQITNQFIVVVREPAVEPVPVLPVQDLVVTGEGLSFRIPTTPGYRYRLLYRASLSEGPWLPFIAPPLFPAPDGWSAPASGVPLSLTDAQRADATRFYRLEQVRP